MGSREERILALMARRDFLEGKGKLEGNILSSLQLVKYLLPSLDSTHKTFHNQNALNFFLLTSPTIKMDESLICVISLNTNATHIKVNSAISLAELKMHAAENLKLPYESLLISSSLEKFPNVTFELLKDEDILIMIDYHRSMGLNTIAMTVTERDEGSIGLNTEAAYDELAIDGSLSERRR